MSLKFFADHCVSNYIIQSLRNADYEVFQLRNYIAKDSADLVVISKAQELDSILLSLNGDFADIVTYPPENYKGIVTLQVRDHPEIIPQLITTLKIYLSEHPEREYYERKLFLVEVHRVRVYPPFGGLPSLPIPPLPNQ